MIQMIDRGRVLTIKDIVKDYGLNQLTVQRMFRSGKVKNAIKFPGKAGYRIYEADWQEFVLKEYGWTGPQKPEDGSDAQK